MAITVRERLAPPGHPDFQKQTKAARTAANRQHAHKLADQVDASNAARAARRDQATGDLVNDNAGFIAGEAVDTDGASRHNADDVAYAYAKQIGDEKCDELGIDKAKLRQKARAHGRTR